jgi:hypothetical protein
MPDISYFGTNNAAKSPEMRVSEFRHNDVYNSPRLGSEKRERKYTDDPTMFILTPLPILKSFKSCTNFSVSQMSEPATPMDKPKFNFEKMFIEISIKLPSNQDPSLYKYDL